MGKTKYYAIRVEFQVRGSPHVHCFLWLANAPVLTSNNKEEYVAFVDQIVHAFLRISSKAVYQVMPELWLRKVFPGVLYANSNIPEKRVRIMLSKKEILELPEDSTDIYKRNMFSRYLIRPHDEMFEHLFYALFI